MAYADPQPHTCKRIAGVTGVALVHVVLAAGLAVGLTVKVFTPEPEPRVRTTDVRLDPPPPDPKPTDTPPDTTQVVESTPVAPTPPFEITQIAEFETVTELAPLDEVIRVVPPVDTTPLAPLTPQFDAHGPLPTNGPAGWITNNEYPTRSLMREQEGTASYALEVDARGEVQGCRITSSTGHRLLDQATCRWVERRAEFDPGINARGEPVGGTYSGTVTWTIPDDR